MHEPAKLKITLRAFNNEEGSMNQINPFMYTGALEGIRVLDMCSTEGQPCGRYLADLGADVIRIEDSSTAEIENYRSTIKYLIQNGYCIKR